MIDKELRERSLNAPARGDAAPREKILKLGKKITDVIDHKLGKITSDDPEYWGLAGIVTDEMADIALSMKLRTPYTVAELWKMNKVTDEQKPHFQELLDQMSYIGLLEYDYGYHYDHNGRTAPQSERRYILPMFVPGSAELFNMEEDKELSGRNPRLEAHPELAKFFERMTYVPLAGKTHLLPPGGGGVGMHVIPVEKAISMENQTLDIEHLSYWLKNMRGTSESASAPAARAAPSWARAVPTTTCAGASAWATLPITAARRARATTSLMKKPCTFCRPPRTTALSIRSRTSTVRTKSSASATAM